MLNTITIKKAVRPFDQAIQVPGDKSISHRAVMLASLAKGRSRISGFLPGEDNLSTIEAFRAMGITIDGPGADGVVTVNGLGLDGLKEPSGDIDCGNSGTTVRLLSGILAGQDFAVTLKGDSSLSSRPMKRVTKPLEEMGARFTFLGEEGKLPYTISGGKLKGIDYKSPVASAQIKSSVLLAGLFAEGETTVTEPLKSRDHTERMLILFGVDVSVDGVSVGVRGGAELQATEVEVPGDISSAAFFMVAAALKKDSLLTIKDVGINPTRIGIIDILKKMGADVTFNDQRGASEPVADIVIKGGALKGVD
ncbi:MAG: 3-phosphoshikimate 1-carboxyvinyltransferase, partial [Deltaproteobacteria bacterium]|nr:3-phosphoshikimate 1-carboxyvinyltransferase [Deltaproteobacteria bacterium]